MRSLNRILRTQANGGPEKLLVFLAKPPTPLPSSIAVAGENLGTGTRRVFDAERHASAGCRQLSVSEGGNQGRVVIEVRLPSRVSMLIPDAPAFLNS